MAQATGDDEQQSLATGSLSVSAAFEGGEAIAEARDVARSFLAEVRTALGLPVSDRVMGMVQLVVSELVTNARKYAPGPCLLTLVVEEGAVQVSVWDSSTTLPAVMATDPGRVGQHGLEIVMGVCRSFAVHREPMGKRITAGIALTDAPGAGTVGRQV
ncbi:ATP-binding protein [Streptomyces sp. NPDC005931]|uniref:ATP-binding protein n=1 Tax=Streptomyces sp. NPDC005931 TaxID=3364737 RepID=UPI003675526F